MFGGQRSRTIRDWNAVSGCCSAPFAFRSRGRKAKEPSSLAICLFVVLKVMEADTDKKDYLIQSKQGKTDYFYEALGGSAGAIVGLLHNYQKDRYFLTSK